MHSPSAASEVERGGGSTHLMTPSCLPPQATSRSSCWPRVSSPCPSIGPRKMCSPPSSSRPRNSLSWRAQWRSRTAARRRLRARQSTPWRATLRRTTPTERWRQQTPVSAGHRRRPPPPPSSLDPGARHRPPRSHRCPCEAYHPRPRRIAPSRAVGRVRRALCAGARAHCSHTRPCASARRYWGDSPSRSELAPKREGAGGVAWQVSGAGEDALRALAAALPGHASTPVRAATAAATQSFAGLRDDEYEEERCRIERREAGLERRMEELRRHEGEVARRAQAVARQREALAREATAGPLAAQGSHEEGDDAGAGTARAVSLSAQDKRADVGGGAEREEDKENLSSPEGVAQESQPVRTLLLR